MSVITDIKEQISDLTTFKHISAAFTEAAAVRLRNIRKAYERNTGFYDEISHIYHLVQINVKLNTPQSGLNTNAKSTNGKNNSDPLKLSVALTSNQRFYGIINNEIMAYFLREAEKNKTEKLIIGSTGVSFMRSMDYKGKYESVIFRGNNPDEKESIEFLNKISPYDQVTIYYPKFISFLKQDIGSIDITKKIPPVEEKEKQIMKEEINLIFEPELFKMIKFFDSQVRMILFKRVVLEAEMARTAARLLAMSQAEERSDFEIKQKRLHLRKVISSFTNSQLLETFSGIKKWKHGLPSRRYQAEMKNKILFLETEAPDVE